MQSACKLLNGLYELPLGTRGSAVEEWLINRSCTTISETSEFYNSTFSRNLWFRIEKKFSISENVIAKGPASLGEEILKSDFCDQEDPVVFLINDTSVNSGILFLNNRCAGSCGSKQLFKYPGYKLFRPWQVTASTLNWTQASYELLQLKQNRSSIMRKRFLPASWPQCSTSWSF